MCSSATKKKEEEEKVSKRQKTSKISKLLGNFEFFPRKARDWRKFSMISQYIRFPDHIYSKILYINNNKRYCYNSRKGERQFICEQEPQRQRGNIRSGKTTPYRYPLTTYFLSIIKLQGPKHNDFQCPVSAAIISPFGETTSGTTTDHKRGNRSWCQLR